MCSIGVRITHLTLQAFFLQSNEKKQLFATLAKKKSYKTTPCRGVFHCDNGLSDGNTLAVIDNLQIVLH